MGGVQFSSQLLGESFFEFMHLTILYFHALFLLCQTQISSLKFVSNVQVSE